MATLSHLPRGTKRLCEFNHFPDSGFLELCGISFLRFGETAFFRKELTFAIFTSVVQLEQDEERGVKRNGIFLCLFFFRALDAMTRCCQSNRC